MKKKFLTNLLLLVTINLLIKPFWFFGIEVAVQNTVGEEMYGFYFSLFNFAFIMNILLDVGITNFNMRKISRQHDLLEPYLSNIIPLKFMLSIVYAVIAFGAGALIGYEAIEFKLLGVLVLNQFLSSFILYLRSNISGLQFFRTDSLLSVLDRTLMILFNGILLWTHIFKQEYKIEWFVYSQTLSYSITVLVVLGVVLYHSGKIKFQFRMNKFREILRMSYPFAILILLMSFFNRADSVMLERLLPDGDVQAGVYAQSFRVLDAFSQFSLLFAGLLLPMFSKMLISKEKVDELVKLAISLLLATSISVAIAGQFFNSEIINLMYHKVVSQSDEIFGLLMIGFIFISVSYIYGTLLTANKSLKELNILAGITVILNVTLNLVLIPRFEAKGAAIASISSQGFYAISQVIVAHKKLGLKYELPFMINILLFSAVSIVTGYTLSHYLAWIPAIIIFVVLSPVLAIIFKFIRPKELIKIMAE